jgi:hypothetical protein
MLIVDMSVAQLSGEAKQNNLPPECGQPIDAGELRTTHKRARVMPEVNLPPPVVVDGLVPLTVVDSVGNKTVLVFVVGSGVSERSTLIVRDEVTEA